MKRKLSDLQPWECMMKRIVWQQLGNIRDKKILDFGSGIGVTASYLAEHNEVIAIEPDENSVKERWTDNDYMQMVGSTDVLRTFSDESFDMIICHNVLEYAADREDIVKEFARILKPDGVISIVKHNRAGRVMQMVVLLNNFEHAHSLLNGNNGMTSKYGAIHYYEDGDIEKWCPKLKIVKSLGMRTFWDMQQNQELHKDADWQDKMVEIEMRVSEMDEYKEIAFFHHLMIEKTDLEENTDAPYMYLNCPPDSIFEYRKATVEDIDELVRTRIIVLRAANKLSDDVDMSKVEHESYEYYKRALVSGEHIAYLVYDKDTFVGAGGVSFYQVMPIYHNPSGKKAYIMNMYTAPEYRRQGIAYHTLDLLVKAARERGISQISLEATEAGRPLYEKYGFVKMEDEMELVLPDA